VIAQTGKQLVPRAADNFHFFAEVCTRMDGPHLPGGPHDAELHAIPAGRSVRTDLAMERAVHDGHVEGCAVPRTSGNTAVLKMSELSPMSAARLASWRFEAGIPAGVLNLVHGTGGEAGEPLCKHPDVRAISFTGSTVTGNRHRAERRAEEVLDGARRQVAVRDLRRRPMSTAHSTPRSS